MSDGAAGGRIGPGLFVAVVGASGTGKDTILRRVQEHFGTDSALITARRHITRATDETEQHVALSAEQFDILQRKGAFALAWQAHGLKYGIACAIDDDIRNNHVVLCNVSRTVIADIRQRYANVFAIEIVASRTVRQARLANRGREDDDDVKRRLDRQVPVPPEGQPDVCIENSGEIDHSVALFVQTLMVVASTQLNLPKQQKHHSARP